MSIPLVQEATKDAINTSIIAIKRNIERINMLLGLSNSEEIDTSEFVKKSDIVNEVALDNMHSVTSNAVAEYARPQYLDTFEYLINGTGGSVTPNINATVVTPGLYAISTYSYTTGQGGAVCRIRLNGNILFTASKYGAYQYAFCQTVLFLHEGDTVKLESEAAPFDNNQLFFCRRIA